MGHALGMRMRRERRECIDVTKCLNYRITYVVLISAGCWIAGCKETLPVYVPPTNILGVEVTSIEQLNDRSAPPGAQVVRIVISCKNIYSEVFYDSIDVKGSLRIWWKRKPNRYRTLYLTEANLREKELVNKGKLLIVPGQSVSLETYWNLKSDDSLYLPTEMNWAFLRRRLCAFNIACADPEEFVIESSLNLYDRLGYVAGPPTDFMFIGRACIECGIGPVCPPPPGGCG